MPEETPVRDETPLRLPYSVLLLQEQEIDDSWTYNARYPRNKTDPPVRSYHAAPASVEFNPALARRYIEQVADTVTDENLKEALEDWLTYGGVFPKEAFCVALARLLERHGRSKAAKLLGSAKMLYWMIDYCHLGRLRHKRHLTNSEKRRICELLATGMKQRDIAKLIGTSEATVSRMKKRCMRR